MSRASLFNMMARDRFSDATKIIVNDAAAAPYTIFASKKENDYVPFSTTAALIEADQPQGNAFVDANAVRVENASGGVDALYASVRTPANEGDIIVLVFPDALVLYKQSGELLGRYSPGEVVTEASVSSPVITTEPGIVYVFNISSVDVAVASNGGSVATIPKWSDGTSPNPPIYTPNVAKGRRVLNATDGRGAFANGNNTVTLTSIEQPTGFELAIDGRVFPLNQSLWLVIARDHWALANQFGVVASQGPVTALARVGSKINPGNHEEIAMTSEATAPGNVYVFNVYSQDLDVSTNGVPTAGGSILGWPLTDKDKYRPNVKAVARVLNSSDGAGKFFNGKNQVTLFWLDGAFLATIVIDGHSIPLNQDLLLFIERNKWQLVNQFGAELQSGDVNSSAELKHALKEMAKEHA